MEFPTSYKVLNKNSFSKNEFSIVPIRFEDRINIMQWRNEQMYHLRQAEKLTYENQDTYFKTIVSKLFTEEKPKQILFSYLKGDECIGYGGLVHINWLDKNAEISFVLKTELEQNEFELHWCNFLQLIEKIGFRELTLHKIFTYAFDLRPHLYKALEKSKYVKEATLKEHCFFNNEFIDVIIHSKINFQLEVVDANLEHAQLLFDWANEQTVRNNSLNNEPIKWENHLKWLSKNIESEKNKIFIFFNNGKPIGQVRLDLIGDQWLIDYSVDKDYRGKGIGSKIIKKTIDLNSDKKLKAEVKKLNIASLKVFEKLGFKMKANNEKEILEFYFSK